jgi:hypothetical protein
MRPDRLVEPGSVPHVKTDRTCIQVEKLAALGLASAEIAYVLGTDDATVQRLYGPQITNGMAMAVSKVGGQLFKNCMKGDTNAIKFFLQARAKWVIPTKVEAGSRDGVNQDEVERAQMIHDIVNMLKSDKKHVPEMSDEAKVRIARRPVDAKLN